MACLRAGLGISPKDVETLFSLLCDLGQDFPEVLHLLVGLQPWQQLSNILAPTYQCQGDLAAPDEQPA